MNNSERISKRMHFLLRSVFDKDNYTVFRESVSRQLAVGSILDMSEYQSLKCAWFDAAPKCGLDTHKSNAVVFASSYSWSLSKVIYTFDPDILESLQSIRWSDIRNQPIDLLTKLPVDNFVIDTGNTFRFKGMDSDFISVHVERDPKFNHPITFRMLFGGADMKADGDFGIQPIHLYLDAMNKSLTFADIYKLNCERAKTSGEYSGSALSEVFGTIKRMFVLTIPYILYLCSKNAEISQTIKSKSAYRPYSNVPKDDYSEIREYICGEPTGIRIRNFRNAQHSGNGHRSGSVKSPHVRRAHYHRFWVGSGEDRHQVIRFLPQTIIHPELIDYMKPVSVKLKSS